MKHENDDDAVPEVDMAMIRSYVHQIARLNLSAKLGQRVDASDIAQDVLLKIHRNWSVFRNLNVAQRIGYAKKTLASAINDAIEKHYAGVRDIRREIRNLPDLDGSTDRLEHWVAAEDRSPSSLVGRAEQTLRASHAIAELPDDERKAFELHFIHGKSFAAAGRLMNVSDKVVARLALRARKNVRQALAITN